MIHEIRTALARGARFLARSQKHDGSWQGYTSPYADFREAEPSENTFTTGLILSALGEIKDSLSPSRRAKAAQFLLGERSAQWSWNYWRRSSRAAKDTPYPDDLDDTSVALAALWKHDPKIVTGAAMAKVVKILTALESKPGGPYRTWLVSKNAPALWHDVDCAVNANIAHLMNLQGIELSGLKKFLISLIRKGTLRSPYYPSPYPLVYFLARGHTSVAKTLHTTLLRLTPRNALETALLLGACEASGLSGTASSTHVRHLLASQSPDGSWPAAAFYIDPARKSRTWYGGSSALTTALVMEALARHRDVAEFTRDLPDRGEARFQAKVMEHVSSRALHFSPELKLSWQNNQKRIAKLDKEGRITLLPYRLKSVLRKRSKRTDSQAVSLAALGFFGWMAYTTYDDILDGDADITALPAANLALREVQRIITHVFGLHSKEESFCRALLDRIDAANAWEVAQCRLKKTAGGFTISSSLPDFKKSWTLSDRSIGHAIPAIGVLFLTGYSPASREVKATLAFFEAYIAARQLNDDAHDWFEDLSKGRVNAASARLLARFRKRRLLVRPLHDRKELETIFWREEIGPLTRSIERHARNARKALKAIPVTNPSYFENLLAPLEKGARIAREESRKAFDFIKVYKKS